MSQQSEYPALVRLMLQTLEKLNAAIDRVENGLRSMGGALKKSVTRPEPAAPVIKQASNIPGATFEESMQQLRQDASADPATLERMQQEYAKVQQRQANKTAQSDKRAVFIAKVRQVCFPDSNQVAPARASWAQTKSIISALGAAVVGGTGGIFLYAVPFLFPVLMLTSLPLLGIGVMVRTLGLMLPKGGDLRPSMKRIGNRALGVGTAIALAPMILVGIPAFAVLHAGLGLGDGLFGRQRTEDTAPATPVGSEAAAPAKATRWTANLGRQFSQALGRKPKAAAPTAETPKAAPADPAPKG